MSAFLGGAEIGFLISILFESTTITSVVHGMCALMLLAQVAMLLKMDFLGNPGQKLVPGRFFPFSPLLEDFSDFL